jgi:hypothetical protein
MKKWPTETKNTRVYLQFEERNKGNAGHANKRAKDTTPWDIVLFEKLKVNSLLAKFAALY